MKQVSNQPLSFGVHSSCRNCGLHNNARSIGIRTRRLSECASPTGQAVFFVGIGPGYTEDLSGTCFVGRSGALLDEFYIGASGFDQVADIFASNLVRCRPVSDKPTKSQIRACRPYLDQDINKIAKRYRRVLIVALGAYASESLTGMKLADSIKKPFQPQANPDNVWVSTTYHPAYLLRDSRSESVVMRHLLLFLEWLYQGRVGYETPPETIKAPVCTVQTFQPGSELATDLETYGCLTYSRDQNTFHPIKMEKIDLIHKSRIIVTAHIAWRNPQGELQTGWFDARNANHLARYVQWLKAAGCIVGQNFAFDAMVIRHCLGKKCLPAWRPIIDAMNETYTLDDLNPRGLKAISLILRITDWEDTPKPVKAYKTYASTARYGSQDAWATYRTREIAWQKMKDSYSNHPLAKWKVSKRRLKWFSNSVWSSILMSEAGVAFDTNKLVLAHNSAQQTMNEALGEARQLGYLLSGPGSDSSSRKLIVDAVREIVHYLELKKQSGNKEEAEVANQDLGQVAGIPRTATGKMPTNVDTRNLLLGLAPVGTKSAQSLSLLSEIKGAQKIIGTYTGPRLYGKDTGSLAKPVYLKRATLKTNPPSVRKTRVGVNRDNTLRLIRVYKRGRYTGVAMSYPSWIILPRSDDKGKAGGVRQFRWSAKDHAIQTDPKSIKNCMTSRYEIGILGGPDYSQMEWRMAAFISNDSVMLQELENGIDPHIETASYLLDVQLNDPDELRAWLYERGAIQTLTRCPNRVMREQARKFAPCKPRDYPSAFLESVSGFCRQEAGKSENFAYLFGAFPPTIQSTVRRKAGFEIPLRRCASMIENNDKKYINLAKMQRDFVLAAEQEGVLHLPILGLSRSFGSNIKDIRGKYRGQLYDLWIQALSALTLQSAVVETQKFQTSSRLPFKVCINNHDFMGIDSAWSCAEQTFRFAYQRMYNNWFLRKLEQNFGRSFPTKAKLEVLAVRGLPRVRAQHLFNAIMKGDSNEQLRSNG